MTYCLHSQPIRVRTPRVFGSGSPPQVRTNLHARDDGKSRETIRGIDVTEHIINESEGTDEALLHFLVGIVSGPGSRDDSPLR